MARDLRSRLAGIRSAPPSDKASIADLRVLPGWTEAGKHFWTRELCRSCPPIKLDQTLDASPFSASLKGVRLSPDGLRFFDLETTGLSGGTGTVAFLATLGRFLSEGRFSTMQFFMDDYPGEAALIDRLLPELSEATALVTYNGAAFDLPLLRTRCILNGRRPPQYPEHIDLLPVSRRLWKTVLQDCTLGTIERDILSLSRGPDIPGSLIPERWFAYLRGGEASRQAMQLVFSHNDSDVRTLASLLIMLARGFKEGEVHKADPLGLAFLLGRSNPELALDILESALAKGDLRTVKPLMRIYWKAGRREDRMELIPFLPEDGYGLYMKSVYAERVEKDYKAALLLAEQALALAEGTLAFRLEQ